MKEVSSPAAPPEGSFPPVSGEGDKKKLVPQDTLDSATLSQTPSVSSEDPLSPVVRGKCSDSLHLDDHSTACSLVIMIET